MNLVKQLQETAKRNQENQLQEANRLLESVKANLVAEDNSDKNMLQFFGTRNVIIEHTDKAEKAKEFIKGGFITKEDIRSVCLKYNLRFLQTKYYKKEIPMSSLNDLRLFKEENRISDYDMKENLMIIAPKDHFSLGDRPKTDPVILYKDKNVYRVVSKWGSDFKSSRLVSSLFARYPNIIILIVYTILLNTVLTIGVIKWAWDSESFFFNISILFVTVAVLHAEINSSEDNWDEPYKK